MESTASVWEDPHCPVRVEWAPDKLNQMRIAVVDAFYAVPRGGIEIGGVLMGHAEGKVIRINNFAAIECEHLTGPSFVLSPKDEAALEVQLASLGGEVVGWFHSHTRSEIHFSPQDTQVHNRFFPKASQIAMVLRPANSQPPAANYFFRGPGGAMTGGATDFLVEPIRSKPVAAEEPKDIPVVEPAATAAAAPDWAPDPVEVKPPRFLRETEPEPGRSFLWLSVALVVAALGAGAFFTQNLWMPK